MKKLKLALLVASFVGASSFQLQAQELNLNNYNSMSKSQQEQNFDQVIIKLEEGYSLDNLKSEGLNFKKVSSLGLGYDLIVLNKQYDIENILLSYEGVESASINQKLTQPKTDYNSYEVDNGYQSTGTMNQQNTNLYNDPLYPLQKQFRDHDEFNYGSSIARMIENKSEQNVRVRVGIIDTGVQNNNDIVFSEDINVILSEQGRQNGASDYSENNGTNCSSGHGIQMSHVIGGIANNNIGAAGIVDADIVMARAVSTDCSTGEDIGNVGDLIRGINWLANEPIDGLEDITSRVDVINISLGANTSSCTIELQNTINNAVANGIVVVASAGNDNVSASNFVPANCDNVIVVGSHLESLEKASFSNFGNEVDFTTLGKNIVSANSSGGFEVNYEGTSFSAAITTGVVSRIKEKYPELNQKEATFVLNNGLENNEICQNADGCGAGMLNAYNSMVIADQFFGFEFESDHYYANRNSCEDTIYLSRMDNRVPVCNLYNVEISHSQSFMEIEYQIVKRDNNENRWTEENTQIVSTIVAEKGVRSVSQLLKEYDSGFDYAIRSCKVNGECIEYKDLDLDNVVKPAFCTE